MSDRLRLFLQAQASFKLCAQGADFITRLFLFPCAVLMWLVCAVPCCRYCLGAALAMAEMKMFLALLARSYSFIVDNDTEWKPALGFYPANGLPLVLTSNSA